MSTISLTSLRSLPSNKKLAEKIRQLSLGSATPLKTKRLETLQYNFEMRENKSISNVMLVPESEIPITYHQPYVVNEINDKLVYKIDKFTTTSGFIDVKPSEIIVKSVKPARKIQFKRAKRKSATVAKIEEVLNKGKNPFLIRDPSEESIDMDWDMPEKDINDLPEEILQRIFFYFDLKERCKILSLVCRSWYYILKNPIYWTELEFADNSVPSNIIIKLIRHSPMLRTLKLIKVPEFATILQQVCRCNNGLKELAVRHCDIYGQSNTHVILNVLSCCSGLEVMDLKGTQFKSKRFFVELGLLKNLKSLNLSSNKHVTSQDLMTLSINCKALKELKLLDRPVEKKVFKRLTDDNASYIISNLKESLTTLKLDVKQLGTQTFQAIFNCPNLTCLCLTDCLLLNGETFRLIKYLENLRKLKITRAIDLSTDDFCDVFNSPNLRKIEDLDVSGCWRIGEAGLRTATENLPRLCSLSLKNCKSINGRCIPHLARCAHLAFLNLSHTCIDSNELADLAIYAKQLKFLTIDRDMCDYFSLQELKNNLSKLKINLSSSEFVKNEESLIDFD